MSSIMVDGVCREEAENLADNWAELAARCGDWKLAYEYCTQALALLPNDPAILIRRATALENDEQRPNHLRLAKDDVISAIVARATTVASQTAIKSNVAKEVEAAQNVCVPAGWQLQRARLCAKLGQFDEALFVSNGILSIWTDCQPALNELLRVYRHKGDSERALEVLNRLLAIEPTCLDYLREKAAILGKQQQYQSQVEVLDQAIRIAEVEHHNENVQRSATHQRPPFSKQLRLAKAIASLHQLSARAPTATIGTDEFTDRKHAKGNTDTIHSDPLATLHESAVGRELAELSEFLGDNFDEHWRQAQSLADLHPSIRTILPAVQKLPVVENEPKVSFENEPKVSFENEPKVSFENEPKVSFEINPGNAQGQHGEPKPTQIKIDPSSTATVPQKQPETIAHGDKDGELVESTNTSLEREAGECSPCNYEKDVADQKLADRSQTKADVANHRTFREFDKSEGHKTGGAHTDDTWQARESMNRRPPRSRSRSRTHTRSRTRSRSRNRNPSRIRDRLRDGCRDGFKYHRPEDRRDRSRSRRRSRTPIRNRARARGSRHNRSRSPDRYREKNRSRDKQSYRSRSPRRPSPHHSRHR